MVEPEALDDQRVVVALKTSGGLGNRMFECLFAHRLVAELPGAVLTGSALPEWGIRFPALPLPRPSVFVQGHRPELARLVSLVRQGILRGIETNCLACRVELLPPIGDVRALFRPIPPPVVHGPGTLLINIRGAEILGPRHKDYRPLPLAHYERLINETGLHPVFMGQLGDDPYTSALRERFPQAGFEPSRGVMEDFATIRAARHVALPVSTFSWLAAWLSEAETIHLPIIGFFHVRRRPEVDLLPITDPRYRFHLFPEDRWDGSPQSLAHAIRSAAPAQELTRREAATLAHGIVWPD
jgi:hypothetical protein